MIYTVALNRTLRYNSRAARELIEIAGSAKKVFGLNTKELKELFCKRYSFFEALRNENNYREAEKEISWAQENDIKILCAFDKEGKYPAKLRECPDYPLILYVKGELIPENKKILSIVGTRRATPHGLINCRRIVEELADYCIDAIIVSGLAYGIDIEAHKAAIDNDIPTVAVLASGLDKIYPVSHTHTANRIIRKGALISEYPRGSESLKANFLQRNRIIAGISDATIVVESGENGGAMITASLAASYSREVFALPGRVGDEFSTGCNLLISRNIASIYISTLSLIESIGWNIGRNEFKRNREPLFKGESKEKEKILLALGSDQDLDIDQLSKATGISISRISSLLLELELEGMIKPLTRRRFKLFTNIL